MVAYTCAISRAFPVYDQKSREKSNQRVDVGFILVGGDATPLSQEEVKCLNAMCEGVRLAQEIVDMPTNLMHTDAFLDVSATTCTRAHIMVRLKNICQGAAPPATFWQGYYHTNGVRG